MVTVYLDEMIKLRKATINDLPVLRYWDTQEHVIQSDPNDDWNWETELLHEPEWREQLMAEINGKPVGFIQIIDPAAEETHYWGDIGPGKRAVDIWIGEKENLGKGYGSEMMKMALARCFMDTRVEEVLVDPLISNSEAIRFYIRMGFRFKERRHFGEDDCGVYVIKRDEWLQTIGNYKES